jgi:hypothetical protein
LNNLIEVYHRPSTVATLQTPPPGSTIIYVPLTGMIHTINVPAGKTYKVMLTANGTAQNLGAISDCSAQYSFFINGTAAGVGQRVSITDGLAGNLSQPGRMSFYYGQWSISHVAVLTGGQAYSIEVRGAHAGPSGNGTNIQLAGAQGYIGEAALNVVIFK